MARHIADGGPDAARAGAGSSLPDMPPGLKKACALDSAYFRANPHARSYTRPYIDGEYLVLTGERPAFMAVAFVSADMRIKVPVLHRDGLAEGKRQAEALAAQWRDGAARGMSA